MNIVFFADNNVGLECISFILKEYDEDIKYIVVVDTSSCIYNYLVQNNYIKEKVIIYKEVKNYDFSSVDYIFLLWWPYIISKDIIELATKGVVNTHPSFLPFNRGKHYNFWNLVEDVPFGVTLHFVTPKIDGGDILFQKKIEKSWEDTGKSLYEKAQKEMIMLFKDKYKNILEGKYEPKKQNIKEGSFHNASELENASEVFLDQKYTARDLLNLLRGRTFLPYNGCFFYDNGQKFEIQINIKKVKDE
jgi:methionyl-tRNA formyltransferase